MKSMWKMAALLMAAAAVLCLGAAGALAAPESSVEETVLVDNDDVSVTVKSFEPEGAWGPCFEMLLENKTDRSLYFTLSDPAVDGVMCDPYWGESVPAGASAYSDLEWMLQSLQEVGVHYIESVNGVLRVFDDDTFEDVYEAPVSWTVTVDGADTPAAEPVVFEHGFPVQEVLTGEELRFSVVDYDPAGSFDNGPQLVFYMENHTDRTVYFSADDVSVNGFVCDPYWGMTVAPGMAAYGKCSWWQDDLEKAHVDEIETVQFTVQATDDDTWDELASADVSVDVTAVPAEDAVPAEASAEAAETAGTAEAPVMDSEMAALIGSTEGNVYTNDYFGVTCTLPENWRFFTDEEMVTATGVVADAVSGLGMAQDLAQQLEQNLRDKQNAYVMAAIQDDGQMNINVMVTNIYGLGAYLSGDDILDAALEQVGIGEDGDASVIGLEGVTLTKQHFTVDGQDLAGIRFEYVDSSSGVDIPLYEQQVYIMGEDYVLQITMTSFYDEGGLDTIASMFSIAD